MTDLIRVTGITGTGFHGVFAHERQSGQPFIVDIECETDFSHSAKTDEISDAVDYGRLATIAYETICGEPMNLIETVADVIARQCLELTGVIRVSVTVHKPQAPIPVPFTCVSVTRSLP